MKKPTTNEDKHLEEVRNEHFPRSRSRRWPAPGGAGWFKCPRALPVLLQVLTDKELVSSGNPGLVYLELLSRVREPGFIILEPPAEHARMVGYSRVRTWNDAMQKLRELGLIETKESHGREFAYALMINPFFAARRLYQQGKIKEPLWNLFHEKWTKARADIPEDEAPSPGEPTVPSRRSGFKKPLLRRSSARDKKSK
jgi:hypothetical protein